VPAAPPQSAATTPPAPAGGDVVEITNEDPGGSGQYRFNPSEVTFKVGQTVTLRLKAETETHTFTVDDLDIDVSLSPGETQDLTFTFDKAGEFDLICIPHKGQMSGKIIVNP
jgi:plastocyanin